MSPEPHGPAGRGRDDGRPNPLVMLGAGVELAGVVAALTLAGWWLDGRWGTSPWLMLAGLVIGFAAGLYNLWQQARRFFQD